MQHFMTANEPAIEGMGTKIAEACENVQKGGGGYNGIDATCNAIADRLNDPRIQGADAAAFRDLTHAFHNIITRGVANVLNIPMILYGSTATNACVIPSDASYLGQREYAIKQSYTNIIEVIKQKENEGWGNIGDAISGHWIDRDDVRQWILRVLYGSDPDHDGPGWVPQSALDSFEPGFEQAYGWLSGIEGAGQSALQGLEEEIDRGTRQWNTVFASQTQNTNGLGTNGANFTPMGIPVSTPNPPVTPPVDPVIPPFPTSGGGGTGSGDGSGDGSGVPSFPPPVLGATWADNQPDQFPEPHNMEDVAAELTRRQGGRHHLLLITHFGAPNANNWLVTIADRGNTDYAQDPNDPGNYSDQFGAASGTAVSSGASLAGASAAGASGLSVSTTASSDAGSAGLDASGASDAVDPDSFLSNSKAIKTELGGTLSPYGQFVAQAIQKYATSASPDAPGATGATGASGVSGVSGQGSLMDGDLGSMIGGMLGSVQSARAPKLTCPPTSPDHPASLWLVGHGLGGMVAQNLAAVKPFPGDNPNLAAAHIVKSVVAFGAPIIGKNVPGVSYDIFKMPGDKIGDIPIDSVGVNDDRARQVHQLKNPFLAPPWQSSDPHKPSYVKDPNDPQLIHNAYADSDELKNTKLPFDLGGKGGTWGPTYVIPVPQSPVSLSAGGTGPGTTSSTSAASPATVLSTTASGNNGL